MITVFISDDKSLVVLCILFLYIWTNIDVKLPLKLVCKGNLTERVKLPFIYLTKKT